MDGALLPNDFFDVPQEEQNMNRDDFLSSVDVDRSPEKRNNQILAVEPLNHPESAGILTADPQSPENIVNQIP